MRLFGLRVYERIWEPLLIAKFGDMRDRVPAYWIWNTLNREKNGSQEVKGYLRDGGNAVIADRLVSAIEATGGRIFLSHPVTRLRPDGDGAIIDVADAEQRFDAVVSTLPMTRLKLIADESIARELPQMSIDYQGVVKVLLVSRARLSRHYWTAAVRSDLPFQGIVETTHVLRPESIGNRHLIYLMNYCRPDSELYRRCDELQIRDAIDGLARLYREFDPNQIESAFVFRAPYVEPVWPCGYLGSRPTARVGTSRIFLATTAQAYPMVTSWNTSVKLADDAVAAVLSAHDSPGSSAQPCRAVGGTAGALNTNIVTR